jgi:hypothetical protein
MVKNALGILAKLTEKRTFQIRYKRILFLGRCQVFNRFYLATPKKSVKKVAASPPSRLRLSR